MEDSLKKFFKDFEKWLEGYPNDVITIALVITALWGIYIALTGNKLLKIGILAYWWFP